MIFYKKAELVEDEVTALKELVAGHFERFKNYVSSLNKKIEINSQRNWLLLLIYLVPLFSFLPSNFLVR